MPLEQNTDLRRLGDAYGMAGVRSTLDLIDE